METTAEGRTATSLQTRPILSVIYIYIYTIQVSKITKVNYIKNIEIKEKKKINESSDDF